MSYTVDSDCCYPLCFWALEALILSEEYLVIDYAFTLYVQNAYVFTDLIWVYIITSAKEVMFLPVFVCLFVCLSACESAR